MTPIDCLSSAWCDLKEVLWMLRFLFVMLIPFLLFALFTWIIEGDKK